MFELSLLDKVCYFSFRCATKTTQLHGLCDASAQAFAAVTYLRSTDEGGVVEVALVASKNMCFSTETTNHLLLRKNFWVLSF